MRKGEAIERKIERKITASRLKCRKLVEVTFCVAIGKRRYMYNTDVT